MRLLAILIAIPCGLVAYCYFNSPIYPQAWESPTLEWTAQKQSEFSNLKEIDLGPFVGHEDTAVATDGSIFTGGVNELTKESALLRVDPAGKFEKWLNVKG